MSKTDQLIEQQQQVKPASPAKVFETQLNSYEKAITDLVHSKNIDPREFIVTTLNSIKRTPDLLNCERSTLFGSILMSAELGLPPNTPHQFAFILPYNRKYKDETGKWQQTKEAQFQIGYQGWQEIMYRNPKIAHISTDVIHENEEFEEISGAQPTFIHKKKKPNERGKAIGVYAVAYLKGSPHPKIVVLWEEELDMYKKISQGAYKNEYKDGKPTGEKIENENSPWNSIEKDPRKWMWRKTAIKQLSKELPKTREMERAYQVDNAAEVAGRVVINEDTVDGRAEVVDDDYLQKSEKVDQKAAQDQKVQQTTGELFNQ